ACEPQHYLLPHRARAQGAEPDATRPMGSWKKAWYRMRTAAGLPGLRPYDLRHHAITRLLENPEVSERTVIEIAGHVSKKMLERYSHIRAKARREAIDALNGKHAPASARRLRLVARKDTG
ncbi:MAG TPA: tyrosine-type recombinase/integrase, partial [Terriglobales bacterium]|nr:tyrosine-type recombinase/integrase [Terriglobales bacterium]